ncbi:MAG: ATP synthase subunit I [Candidatus Acidiferrales bacterium]
MTETPLPSPDPAAQERFHQRYSRRILTYTLISGLVAATAAAIVAHAYRWGAGIAVGTALAWLNYRWLDQALGGLVTSAQAQEGSPKAMVPLSLYAKFIGRYLLIGITLYVIVKFFRVPIVACLVGLLALGSGTIAAALQDVFSGND